MEPETLAPPLELTGRQRQVLEFLASFLMKHGYQPTMLEISREIGIHSRTAAKVHLQALARKGWIIGGSGEARAVRFLFLPDGEPFRGVEFT